MLKVPADVSIFVSLEPMDMRKAINGLSVWVSEELNRNPQCGDLYIFVNQARNRIKILYWDRNGFVLHHKRLEKHKFCLPKPQCSDVDVLTLSPIQLQGLLAGLDVMLMQTFSEIEYDTFI